MSDLQLYTKITALPPNLRKEVEDFVDFLNSKIKKERVKKPKIEFGLAKGLIKMKENFDDPIEDFKEYM